MSCPVCAGEQERVKKVQVAGEWADGVEDAYKTQQEIVWRCLECGHEEAEGDVREDIHDVSG